MGTVLLLLWLLVPLSWGIDLSICNAEATPIDLSERENIDFENCEGDWTGDGEMYKNLAGFVRRVADECLKEKGKDNGKWSKNKEAAECTMKTVFDRDCNPYTLKESQAVMISRRKRSSEQLVHPFELACEYYKERILKENGEVHNDIKNCKKFNVECQLKFDQSKQLIASVCDSRIDHSGLECPKSGNMDIFIMNVLQQCTDIQEIGSRADRRRCLFKTIYHMCLDERKKFMQIACQKLRGDGNGCEQFSEECFGIFEAKAATTVPTSAPITPSTLKKTSAEAPATPTTYQESTVRPTTKTTSPVFHTTVARHATDSDAGVSLISTLSVGLILFLAG